MKKMGLLLFLILNPTIEAMEVAVSGAIIETLKNPEGLKSLETPILLANVVLTGGQVITFLILKKKNMWFGKKLIPQEETNANVINQDFYPRNVVNFLSFAPVVPSVLQTFLKVNSLNLLSVSSVLVNSSSIIHIINLAQQDSIRELRTNQNRILEIKQTPGVIVKDNDICIICRHKPENPVNICERKEHLYCQDCLTKWLETVNENTENLRYPCELCRKDIPDDMAERTIVARIPTKKEVMWNMIGIKGLCAIVLLYCMYNVLF